jgi:phosphoketolase
VVLTGEKNSLTRFALFPSALNRYAKNTPTDTIIIHMMRKKLDVVQQATKENCGNNAEISYARWNLMN